MRAGVKRSTSSHSDGPHRYHNLLYIPFGTGHSGSSGVSTTATTNLTPIEYIIYPIGLRKVLLSSRPHTEHDSIEKGHVRTNTYATSALLLFRVKRASSRMNTRSSSKSTKRLSSVWTN